MINNHATDLDHLSDRAAEMDCLRASNAIVLTDRPQISVCLEVERLIKRFAKWHDLALQPTWRETWTS